MNFDDDDNDNVKIWCGDNDNMEFDNNDNVKFDGNNVELMMMVMWNLMNQGDSNEP